MTTFTVRCIPIGDGRVEVTVYRRQIEEVAQIVAPDEETAEAWISAYAEWARYYHPDVRMHRRRRRRGKHAAAP